MNKGAIHVVGIHHEHVSEISNLPFEVSRPHGRGVWVHTCNRIEWFLSESPPSLPWIEFHKSGVDAVEHLFLLVTGAISQVQGDLEIFSQVKEAHREATHISPFLDRVFQRAFRFRKMVHAPRQAALATRVSKQIPESDTVLVVGAGGLAEDLVRQLPGPVHVTNRTESRARRLSDRVVPFERLRSAANLFDTVIFATHAPHPLLDADAVGAFVIDLSNPPNVQNPDLSLSDLSSDALNFDRVFSRARQAAERFWQQLDVERDLNPKLAAFQRGFDGILRDLSDKQDADGSSVRFASSLKQPLTALVRRILTEAS